MRTGGAEEQHRTDGRENDRRTDSPGSPRSTWVLAAGQPGGSRGGVPGRSLPTWGSSRMAGDSSYHRPLLEPTWQCWARQLIHQAITLSCLGVLTTAVPDGTQCPSVALDSLEPRVAAVRPVDARRRLVPAAHDDGVQRYRLFRLRSFDRQSQRFQPRPLTLRPRKRQRPPTSVPAAELTQVPTTNERRPAGGRDDALTCRPEPRSHSTAEAPA